MRGQLRPGLGIPRLRRLQVRPQRWGDETWLREKGEQTSGGNEPDMVTHTGVWRTFEHCPRRLLRFPSLLAVRLP